MSGERVRVRRIYDEPAAADGARVLVDRIWPRGMSKARAHLDDWCKQVAPSTELRKWYQHDPARFAEFDRRYRDELSSGERAAALDDLRRLAQTRPVTLLTATRDADLSEAAVLAEVLNADKRRRA